MCCHCRCQPGLPVRLRELWPFPLPSALGSPANPIKPLPNWSAPDGGVWQHQCFQHLCHSWSSLLLPPRPSSQGWWAQRADLAERHEQLQLNQFLSPLDGHWNPPRQKQNQFPSWDSEVIGSLLEVANFWKEKKKSFFSNLYPIFLFPPENQTPLRSFQSVFNRYLTD